MSEPTSPTTQRARARRGSLAVLGFACVLGLTTCASGMAGQDAGTATVARAGGGPPPATVAGAPGGGAGDPGSDRTRAGGQPVTAEGATLPLAEDADPSREFPAVRTQQPRVRLTGGDPGVADPVATALEVEGVRFATAIRVGDMPIAVEDGPTTIETAVVEPHAYRVFAPQVTADATDVWRRLADGDLAVTHQTGQQLGLELGDRVPAGGDASTARIGAFASNGIPPVAQAIVSRDMAQTLGFDGRRQVLVSVEPDADHDAVAQRLGEATGLEPELIEPPATQQADQEATGHASTDLPADAPEIRPFTYQSIGDGMVRIDSDWVSRYIVSADVPILSGPVTCHEAMIPQLRAALEELRQRGLADLIRPGDFGGCWTPRHVLFDPRRNLSMHAWGLAIDLNVSTNAYGARPQMDPRVVEVFERWGFAWGGDWSTPDGMHFQLETLIDRSG